MHKRTTLKAGEHGRIDLLTKRLVIREDDTATPGPKGLVRGRGHHMRVWHRVRVNTCRNKTRDMGHVDHQIGTDLIRNFAELGKIESPRIGRSAGQNDLWLTRLGLRAERVEIDQMGRFINAILFGIEPFARQVRGCTVGQVTTRGKRHAKNGIAGLQQRQEHGLVRLRAGMRLHINECGTKQLFCAFDRKRLDNIGIFTTAIIAATGIALGIFVRQNRSLCLQHRCADDVFRGDHLDLVLLTDKLVTDCSGKIRVGIGKRCREEAVHYVLFSDVIHDWSPNAAPFCRRVKVKFPARRQALQACQPGRHDDLPRMPWP